MASSARAAVPVVSVLDPARRFARPAAAVVGVVVVHVHGGEAHRPGTAIIAIFIVIDRKWRRRLVAVVDRSVGGGERLRRRRRGVVARRQFVLAELSGERVEHVLDVLPGEVEVARDEATAPRARSPPGGGWDKCASRSSYAPPRSSRTGPQGATSSPNRTHAPSSSAAAAAGRGGGGGEDRVVAPSAVVEEVEVVLAGERVAAAAVVAEGVAVGGMRGGAPRVFVILEAGAKTGRVLVQEVQLAKKTRTGVSATSRGEEAGEGKGREPRIRRISRRRTWRE